MNDAASPQPGPAGHYVLLANGDTVDGLDFGNRQADPSGVSGRKWVDRNGNGQRDVDEPGLGGVTVYSDLNFNGMFDTNEPNTNTREDNPVTDFDEAGLYVLGNLIPGLHWIREVVPVGSIQTYPQSPLAVVGADSHMIRLGPGEHRDGLNFGNRPLPNHGALPADFNRDGAVDDADRQMWRQTFGSTTNLSADANGDGVVNAADHVIWRNQRGNAATSLSGLAPVSAPAQFLAVTQVSSDDANAGHTASQIDILSDGRDRLSGVRQLLSRRTDIRTDIPAADADAQFRQLDRLRDLLRNSIRPRDKAFEVFGDSDTDTTDEQGAMPLASGVLAATWDGWA
jgi:hypothetical protein